MNSESNILCAEILLAKYFTENEDSKEYPVRQVLQEVKFPGVTKSDFKEARKRLGIQSKQIEGAYYWKWGSKEQPKKVWKDKSKEALSV